MSRPMRKTYSMVAADPNGISLSQTPLAAGNLTITGALASGGSVTLTQGQHVSITAAADETGRTFTFTGTDQFGNTITEVLAGPNIDTTDGNTNFKTITQIAVDAATAGAITAGVLGEAEFTWIPMDRYLTPFEYSYYVDIGTATFVVESTLDNVQDTAITPVVNATVEASGTVDVGGNSKLICTAIRVTVTAFTSGDITLTVVQSGHSGRC